MRAEQEQQFLNPILIKMYKNSAFTGISNVQFYQELLKHSPWGLYHANAGGQRLQGTLHRIKC